MFSPITYIVTYDVAIIGNSTTFSYRFIVKGWVSGKLQLHDYIHFWTNALGKGEDPLPISPSME